MEDKTISLIFYLFNFSAVCLLLHKFLLQKFFSDMFLYLQWDHVQKMQFQTSFKFSLHHVGDNETSQTQFNIFNFFLSPSWRLGPQNSCFFTTFFSVAFCKVARDWSIIHVDKPLDEWSSFSYESWAKTQQTEPKSADIKA